MRRKGGVKRWIVAGFLAAVLFFVLTMLTVPLLMTQPEPFPTYQAQAIRPYELVLEREEPEPEREEQTRQIVSIDAPETEQVPDEARFEDRVNRAVEEETAARVRGVPGAVPTPPAPAPEPRERRRSEPRQTEEDTQPVEEPVAAVLDHAAGEEVARASTPNPNEAEPRTEPQEQDRLELAAFRPTMERAADFVTVPGAGSMDYIDAPPGERDMVNSFENMYWSFWERIKNQVRPHWRPASVYRQRDPTGRVFGVEDRYTVLRVTLNGDGSLRHIFLERSSDLDFLDREAIRAVREAQPFSNVPEGLKDERGLLSFRFGFYFEVSSAAFRIRREDW